MDGILIISKPQNYTSHDIVAIIKKISKEKVGHTGTLDPLATGVLPLLVGEATKISKYLINHDKTYIATIQLGKKTNTADSEGRVLEEKEVGNLEKSNIEKVLFSIIGKQEQIPPMYSAIKVNGKKLYEYARKGEKIEITPRAIEIYNIKLINFKNKEKQITFKIECSKGTYIRTVCEDIAVKLNTVGYMKELKRIKVGEFTIESAVDIEKIKNNEIDIQTELISIEQFFKEKENINLTDEELKKFLNGVEIKIERISGLYKIYNNNNKFVGLGIIENNKLKRDIVKIDII